jgi:hypothetical protein
MAELPLCGLPLAVDCYRRLPSYSDGAGGTAGSTATSPPITDLM